MWGNLTAFRDNTAQVKQGRDSVRPSPAERAMVRLLDAARPYTRALHHAPFQLNLSCSVPEAIQVTPLDTSTMLKLSWKRKEPV